MPDNGASEKTAFLKHVSVPHETVHKLTRYAESLSEWNRKFNLVAESTLPHIWTRHFLDSAQLMRFIPEKTKNLADLGSGAGFPGLVLSILGIPGVHLIESTGKKADFLRTNINEFGLTATVHQERIENLHGLKADIVTARALKPLPDLLKLAYPLMKKDSTGLFLKGKNLEDELTESARWWTFDHEKYQSLSDPSGNVLIIRDLKPKNAAPRKNHRNRKK